MSKKILISTIVFISSGFILYSQSNQFVGSFINTSNTISLQFKSVGNEMHGLLQTSGASFAMRGSLRNNQLNGKIYGFNGPIDFSASMNSNGLMFSSSGDNELFYKMSNEHALANVDLTQYMLDFSQYNNNAVNIQSEDYNYSYSQHNEGYSTENYQANSNKNNATSSSPYQAYNDRDLQNIIAGGQLVYYTRTSYVSDNVASSITYVNFCANGSFSINYDGSFSVEGNYGGNAQGASYGENSGTWQLVSYQGQPAVFMSYNNGSSNINPVDKNKLIQGRWRIGNTQYAFQRNKVNCY